MDCIFSAVHNALPLAWAEKNRQFWTDKFDTCNTRQFWLVDSCKGLVLWTHVKNPHHIAEWHYYLVWAGSEKWVPSWGDQALGTIAKREPKRQKGPQSVCKNCKLPKKQHNDPGYMSRKIRKFRTDKFDMCNKWKIWLECHSCKVAWVIISVCYTCRIYPFEIFEFLCSSIRHQCESKGPILKKKISGPHRSDDKTGPPVPPDRETGGPGLSAAQEALEGLLDHFRPSFGPFRPRALCHMGRARTRVPLPCVRPCTLVSKWVYHDSHYGCWHFSSYEPKWGYKRKECAFHKSDHWTEAEFYNYLPFLQ